MHIAFFHLDTQDLFPDKKLANIAADMEINQYIDHSWLPGRDLNFKDFDKKYGKIADDLGDKYKAGTITIEEYRTEMLKIPARGVYIEDYAEMKLDPRAGTRYYYDKLKKAADDKQKSSGKGEDSLAGAPGNGDGTSGSKALDGLLDNMADQIPVICDHPSWKEFEGMSEADKRLMKSQTDFHLKEIADSVLKSRGTIPSELADYISKIDQKEPPKFDWKGYLRRFAGGSTKIYTKKLHRKYNKRFDENPGLKIKPKRHILVAVDTSGSVSDNELREFFHEIHHIHRNGSDVTVVECDAAISKITSYKKNTEDTIKVHGRGGTSFDPPCEYYTANKHKFTCMIYFTDGEAPPPVEPIRGRILWVLSSTSGENDNLPGQIIKLN